MAQRLTPSVGAGDVVLLLAVVMSQLPSGAAGERLALAGTLCAVWLTMSGGRARSSHGRFAIATTADPRSSTRAETGARRAGRDPG